MCGRTILKGERTRTYLTPDGERRPVCELCRTRAESIGWVWEEVSGDRPAAPQRARRRRSALAGLLRGRSSDSRTEAGEEPSEEAPESSPPARRRRSPDPAAPGAGVGRAGPGEAAGSRFERAVARFNRSEHARTVAGLTRTLGQPSVSVGMAAGSPADVRITVAWELSWYQWSVDIGDEARPVHEIDKGHEIDQIDGPARQWNAHAADDGSLRLGPARAPASGEPAGAEG